MKLIDPMLDELYVKVTAPSTDNINVGVLIGNTLEQLVFPAQFAIV